MPMKLKRLMEAHCQNPLLTPASEVMKKGGLKDYNTFYRLFYKWWKEERLKELNKE